MSGGMNVHGNAGFHANYNVTGGNGGGNLGFFADLGGAVGSFAGKLGKSALDLKSGGAASALTGGGASGGTDQLGQLLAEQNRLQLEMQTFSMISNISKTEHESRMNLVRNMRP
jgi:hypothetical protein